MERRRETETWTVDKQTLKWQEMRVRVFMPQLGRYQISNDSAEPCVLCQTTKSGHLWAYVVSEA